MIEPPSVDWVICLVFAYVVVSRLCKWGTPKTLVVALTYTFFRIIWDVGMSYPHNGKQLVLLHLSHTALIGLTMIWMGSRTPRRLVDITGKTLFIVAVIFTLLSKLYSPIPECRDWGWLCGIIFTPGLNVSLIAIAWFYFRGQAQLYAWLIAMVFVVWGASSAGWASMVAVLATGFFIACPWLGVGLAILGFALGHFLVPDWYGWERWDFYKFFARDWWVNHNHWLGAGVNHFAHYGPRAQMVRGNPLEIWVHAHSDWFQLLYEQGFIGLAVWGVAYLALLSRLFLVDQDRLPIAVALGVIGLVYFPLHAMPFLILFGMSFSQELQNLDENPPARNGVALKCNFDGDVF